MLRVFRWIGGVFVFFSTLWFIMATPLLAQDMAHRGIVAGGCCDGVGDYQEPKSNRDKDRR